jgi:signal transduction histidine kinase
MERSHARWLPLALAPAAVVCAVTAIGVASRHGELTTYAGRSTAAATVELAAGLVLIGAGAATWWLRPARVWGALAMAAGIAWFAPDWIGWQGGPGGVRIAAVATQGVVVAAAAHLAITSGSPRLARPLVAAIWAATAAVAVGRLLLYDPLGDPACFDYCAANPLLVGGGDHAVARGLDLADAALAVFATLAALGAAVTVALRTGAARRSLLPLVLPALALLAAWAVRVVALAADPGDDPQRGALVASFVARAVAMAALAAGLLWAVSRARRGALALRRLGRASGSLEDALASATGDAMLRVAFPLTSGDGWIDGDGAPVAMPARGGDRAVSLITREDRPIAAVLHDAAGLDARALQEEVGAAARLAVDNERLRAEARAQLRELRLSRARIVEAGDAERRRLERDLHDGAQQRLVGVGLVLGMARARCSLPALDAADADLHRAIDDLRDLAHGIHPVELSDEGLAAALETLANRATVPVRLAALPEERMPPAVETAAYVLVDEALRLASARGCPLAVAARRSGDVLDVEVRDEGAPSAGAVLAELADVADRVSVLDGRLEAREDGGVVVIRAALPCA